MSRRLFGNIMRLENDADTALYRMFQF